MFGEVSSKDIEKIKNLIDSKFPFIDILDMSNRAGQSRFGTMVAYNNDVLSFVNSTDLTTEIGNRTSRIGQHFLMSFNNTSEKVNFFISHWPSRSRSESTTTRERLGMLLSDRVVSIIKSNQKEKIILMGDYNDEPFDKSITEYLHATRDRDTVGNSSHLLYNPFWKHLYGEKKDSSLYFSKFPGTYFYKSDTKCKWKTFDQIMVSPSLVSGESGWIINEKKTKVFSHKKLVDLISKRNYVFDHLPIVGVIEKI